MSITGSIQNGKTPMSRGRDVHTEEPLCFPVGRTVGADTFQYLEGEELFLNTLVSGGKGKGKTAAVIKPFLRFIIAHPRRCGALVLDAKGDLLPYIQGWARLAGREEDIINICPRGTDSIHLFPPGLPAESLANGIVTAIHTINGGNNPKDSFWENSAEELMKFLITLLRMHREDMDSSVSPSDLLGLVGQLDRISTLLHHIDIRYESEESHTAEEKHNIDYLQTTHDRYTSLDNRMRTSIEAELSRFLKDFSGFHFKRTFCPANDDATAVSIADIVTEGRIVVLNMPSCEYGEVSRFIGLLLKTQFYDSVMRRLRERKQAIPRPVFLVADEYQNYATLGGRVGADDQFAALCRQASAGMLCATQEIGALYSVAGANCTEAVSNLLQNFQNHIILQQTLTPRMIALLDGKGIRYLECIPKLRAFEAIFFKDTRPEPVLVELGPVFASWDYAAALAAREASELSAKRDNIVGHVLRSGTHTHRIVVVAGESAERNNRFLESLYLQCQVSGVPSMHYGGKYDRPDNIIERLAHRCSYSRAHIENSVIFIDDVDVLSDDPIHPAGKLYHALLPILSGRRRQYGKHNDIANFGKICVIMSATTRQRGSMNSDNSRSHCVIIPGVFADSATIVDIDTVDTYSSERNGQ